MGNVLLGKWESKQTVESNKESWTDFCEIFWSRRWEEY